MNYRSRWQQRRENEGRRRVVLVVAAAVVLVAVVLCLTRSRRETVAWSHDFFVDSPVFFRASEGIVYCCLPAGLVGALSTSSGAPLWPKPFRAAMGFGVPPEAGHGRAIVVNDNQTITALSSRTGDPIWQVGTHGPVRCPPLIHDRTVFVGSDDGRIYALDVKDGVEKWRYDAGSPVNSGFCVLRNVLICGTADGQIVGVRASTGEPMPWHYRATDVPVHGLPLAMGTRVAIGSDGGGIYIIEPGSGNISARGNLPESGLVRAGILADEKSIYAASTDGWLVAFEREDPPRKTTLRTRWSRDLGPEIAAGPAMDKDYLYCATGGQRVLAVSKMTGGVVRRWSFPATVRGSLALVNDLLIAGTEDGRVVACRNGLKSLPSRTDLPDYEGEGR